MESQGKSPADQLEERLRLLVFFHLGADAVLELDSRANGLRVSVEHPRVRPFVVDLAVGDLERMSKDHEALEDHFLDLLVANRRG